MPPRVPTIFATNFDMHIKKVNKKALQIEI
jgi:hypothetical protein